MLYMSELVIFLIMDSQIEFFLYYHKSHSYILLKIFREIHYTKKRCGLTLNFGRFESKTKISRGLVFPFPPQTIEYPHSS